jgi:hypothetical protein
MTFQIDALRAAALKTLADDVETALSQAKHGLRDEMGEIGVDRVTAKLPDGTKVASLPLAGGEARARVTKPEVFEAWVREHRPDQLVTTVNPAYVKYVLDQANTDGTAVNEATGEVIPGVEFTPSTPYVAVNFAKGRAPGEGGRELIRDAWRTGALQITELLAIEAGDGHE